MTQTPDNKPDSLTWLDKIYLSALVFGQMSVVFGSLIGSIWFLPSPWYLVGAVPATFAYWLGQRETIAETLVIFLMLMFLAWVMSLPVQQFRDYLYPDPQIPVVFKVVFRLASSYRIT